MKRADVLIVGSGIGGAFLALKVATSQPDRLVILLSKDELFESNSRYAQGGVASVANSAGADSFDSHIQDTLKAGDGLCDPSVVEMVIRSGPDRLKELEDLGVQFDRIDGASYHLSKEGGHSFPRVHHFKDETGREIENTLLRKVNETGNIETLSWHFVLDLLVEQNQNGSRKCMGATVIDLEENEILDISAGAVVLASGGCGQIHKNTTNPPVATGDGIGLAVRHGVDLYGMEFIQFHPTAFHDSFADPKPLISEAVRGAGARLLNGEGAYFMEKYDDRAELASRDIVTRAIYQEMKKEGRDHVYLDLTFLPGKELHEQFPSIQAFCASKGFDPTEEPIPVSPAAHYSCGGIVVNENGHTSLEGLFALGEVTWTGLHGANRLASNSLLEALVFAHRIDRSFLEDGIPLPSDKCEGSNYELDARTGMQACMEIRQRLRDLMDRYAGPVRSRMEMGKALDMIEGMEYETEALTEQGKTSKYLQETRNLLIASREVLIASLARKGNVGLFYCIDPE